MSGWIIFYLLLFPLIFFSSLQNSKFGIYYLLIILFSFAGFRYRLGYDYDTYTIIFDDIRNNRFSGDLEFGWVLINKIASQFNNVQIIYFISSCIIYLSIILCIKRDSPSFGVSLLIFLFNQIFFWESMAMIRQYIAIAFFALSLKYVEEKNFRKFLFLNLIGLMFHKSSLLIIPFYFILDVELTNIKVIFLIGVSFLLTSLVSEYIYIFNFFSKYTAYFNGTVLAAAVQKTGASFFFRCVFVTVLLFYKEHVGYNNRKNRIYINMLIIGYIIYLILYNNTALRRIAYYFMYAEVIVVPLVIIQPVKRYLLSLIKYGLILFYFIFIGSTYYYDVFRHTSEIRKTSLENKYYLSIFSDKAERN